MGKRATRNLPAGKPYFHTLDGLRGVAALLVVTFHAAPFLGIQLDPLGYAGVDLFFLLSGVVIETSYGGRLREGMRGATFLQARALRLYPLYALSTLIMLLAIALSPSHGIFINASATQVQLAHLWPVAAMAFLCVPFWNVLDMYPLNQPAWSLFFEVMANFVWLILHPWLTNRLLSLIILLSLTGLLCNIPHPNSHMLDGLSRAGFSFFLGVWLARNPPKRSGNFFGSAALLLISSVLLCLRPAGHGNIIWLALVTLAFPCLVRAAMAVQPPASLTKICGVLGDLSYPLYIVQTAIPPLLFFALPERLQLHIAFKPPWPGLILITMLCAISWALHIWFDAPLRRWLGSRLPQHQNSPCPILNPPLQHQPGPPMRGEHPV